MLWVRISIRAGCTTLCDKVCQWLATGRWFSPGTPVSSTNKTDRLDITEILITVYIICFLPGSCFVQLVDLISHLVCDILLFLAKYCDLGLIVECCFFHFTTNSDQFLFTFLVEVNLGLCGTSLLFQLRTELIQLSWQLRALFFNLKYKKNGLQITADFNEI